MSKITTTTTTATIINEKNFKDYLVIKMTMAEKKNTRTRTRK